MNAQFFRFVTVAGLCVTLARCGSSPDSNLDLRNKISGLDGSGVPKIDFYFGLPDRSRLEGADASALIDAFYYKLEGKGEKCPPGEIYEATVDYEDNLFIDFPIASDCSYDLDFRAGRRAAAAGEIQLAAQLNFASDIKPLLEKNCTSCHAEYSDYAKFRQVAAQSILDIESGIMPPAAPLSDGDIAVFLAWQAGGYLEVDDSPAESAEAQKLGTIFYRNNSDDVLNSYEFLGRTFYELARTLWIQPEGQAEGLSSKYVTLSERPVEQD